jgi:tRNA (cytidine/uridine-2'-O-)-methyltransferase
MVETYVWCLNLSFSVGIALYEAARQLNYEQLQYQPKLPEEARGLFPEDIYA